MCFPYLWKLKSQALPLSSGRLRPLPRRERPALLIAPSPSATVHACSRPPTFEDLERDIVGILQRLSRLFAVRSSFECLIPYSRPARTALPPSPPLKFPPPDIRPFSHFFLQIASVSFICSTLSAMYPLIMFMNLNCSPLRSKDPSDPSPPLVSRTIYGRLVFQKLYSTLTF